jgi:adenylyltransferase/sulfurtransferase
MSLSDDELERYARHLVLREVGGPGQARIRAARVLVIGAGGLGSPCALYLAAAGVGAIGLVDDDTVSLSNLQRQILFRGADVGRGKVEAGAAALAALNPHVTVEPHPVRLTEANAAALFAAYDIIADGSDNFATRYLLTDACFLAKRTLVAAAILRFEGQLSTYKPHLGPPHPCYRCVFPEPPPPDAVPSCAQAGVLGAMAGTVGAWQATEAVKEILGVGESLSGKLLLYDALDARVERLAVARRADCPLCGPDPAITSLDSPLARASYAEVYCGG